MADPLLWFHVLTNDKGEAVSIKQVTGPGENCELEYFVRATSLEQAGKLAFRAYQRDDNKKRRERYIADGCCPYCGRKQDRKPRQRCSICLESHAKHRQRARQRQRGELVEPANVKATRDARREAELESIKRGVRLDVLREIDAMWRNAANAWVVRQWLRKEIEELTGKEVA